MLVHARGAERGGSSGGQYGHACDIDLWFEDPSDVRIVQAVREVGGFWVSGSFGLRPPQIGGMPSAIDSSTS